MVLEGLKLAKRSCPLTVSLAGFTMLAGAFLTCCLLVSVIFHACA
jgi:hypothetical protein